VNDDAHRDVLAVLTRDHREVQRFLDELATTRDRADPRLREALVDQITTELNRHSAVEEQFLYPAVREHVPGGTELADREIRENVQIKWTLRELEGVDPADAPFEVTLRRLTEQVKAHVIKAEETLFPRVRSYCAADDLMELGKQVSTGP